MGAAQGARSPLAKRWREFPHYDLSEALCRGKSALFDSTIRADHREAKELCNACPALLDCTRYLAVVREASTQAHGARPTGTWAGQLLVSKGESSA